MKGKEALNLSRRALSDSLAINLMEDWVEHNAFILYQVLRICILFGLSIEIAVFYYQYTNTFVRQYTFSSTAMVNIIFSNYNNEWNSKWLKRIVLYNG